MSSSDIVYLVRTPGTGCPPVAVCFTLDDAEIARAAFGATFVEPVPMERARSMGHVNADGRRLGRA